MRIAFTGGGTGGHIYPTLAIATELDTPDNYLIYIGTDKSLEQELCHAAKIKFISIMAGKMRRYFALQNISDFFRFLIGCLQSIKILKQHNIQIVFAKGGYVSLPLGIAAKILKIPLIIHESDTISGLSNRIMGRLATKICLTFNSATSSFTKHQNKVILTGLPIRNTITKLVNVPKNTTNTTLFFPNYLPIDEALPIIFITCGSQGAQAINEAIAAELTNLLQFSRIIHLTGKGKDFDPKLPQDLKARYYQTTYSSQIIDKNNKYQDLYPIALNICDLVIMRAGSSIFEAALLAKPLILVPLPSSAQNHQYYNAQFFVKHQAATLVTQDQQLAAKLLKASKTILTDKFQRQTLAKNITKLGQLQATAKIIKVIKSVLRA